MNKRIMNLISNRLDVGAVKYGEHLDINDGRDWEREALEEVLDCMVYAAARLLQLDEIRIEKEGLHEPTTADDFNT